MRAIANVLAMSVCMLLIGTPLAFADDASDELAEMRTMVEQLKGQVDAQSEQIAHQGDVIREARLEQADRSESRFGSSGITAFLQRLVVEGHVSGSYFWNFNQPGPATGIGGPFGTTGGNTGISGNTYPFHANHNSFQVDQVWFGIEHPVDAENRAGFRFDLVYGTTACTMGNAVPVRCGFGGVAGFFGLAGAGPPPPPLVGAGAVGATFNDNTSQFYVNQAYVQYLAPITDNGILIKAGKWNTLVGIEVPDTTANFNITRGNVFSIFQPIDHVGVLASTDIGETGFSGAFGVMNDDHNSVFGAGGLAPGALGPFVLTGAGSDPDRNEAKSIAFQIGWSGETISVASTLLWGPSVEFNDNDSSGLLDLLLTWDPNEKLSTWINWDYAWDNDVNRGAHAWGLAMAGRYAVTERMGVSTRFEVVRTDGEFGPWVNTTCIDNNPVVVAGCRADVSNGTIYSLTGTVDYALTSNLMLRGELRYDNVNKDFNDNEFFDSGGDFRPDQTTAGVEIVYEF
jgi:hypothetical protein